MSTELARTQGTNLTDKLQYAKALASANLLPRQYQQNPGNVLFALEYADALGVSPIHAITSIHVIEGRPSASADLIGSLVRRAGHKLRVTGDDTKARAVIIRADDPDFEYVAEWDMAKAKAANLTGKGVWKSYPGAMLRARAITEVARMGASDALYGVVYTPEELGANVDADGEPVDLGEHQSPAPSPVPEAPARTVTRQRKGANQPQPAPEPAPEPEPTAEVDWIGRIDDCATVDELRTLWMDANAAGADKYILDTIEAASKAPTPEQAAQNVTDILDAEVVA